MKMIKLIRLFAAGFTLFALLFTQLAVAAYACPEFSQSSLVASTLLIDPDMPGCQGMQRDQAAPALCAAHCDTAAQSSDTPSAPTIQPFIQAALTLVLLQDDGPRLANYQPDYFQLIRSGSPPLIISNCCFRI
jgi:hypothetical protein